MHSLVGSGRFVEVEKPGWPAVARFRCHDGWMCVSCNGIGCSSISCLAIIHGDCWYQFSKFVGNKDLSGAGTLNQGCHVLKMPESLWWCRVIDHMVQ